MNVYKPVAKQLAFAAAFFGLVISRTFAAVLVVSDPALNTGTSAINNRSLVAAAGSTAEATLEALTNFAGIASFPFVGNIAVTNEYIFDFTSRSPDLRLRYIGASNQFANTSVALSNATYSTSSSEALRLGVGGTNRLFTMRIDAGTYAPGAFTADRGLSALGFTLSMSTSSAAMPVNIKYYDSANNLLSAQTVSNLTSAISYRYTGFQSAGAPIAYAEIVYSTTGLAAAPVVALDDLSFAGMPEPSVSGSSFLFALMTPILEPAGCFVITNPPVFQGSAAINPAARTLTPAVSSASENGLEAIPGFTSVHDFEFDGNASGGNEYIFDFRASGAVDARLTYSGNPAGTVKTTSSAYSTSYSGALRLQTARSGTIALRIDFGTWNGTDFLNDQAVDAVGFTLCASGNSSATVQINAQYYSAEGALLSQQQMITATGMSYHLSGYKAAEQPAAYVIVSYEADAWLPVITLDDLAFSGFSRVWNDPLLVQGANAIDPPGGAMISVEASGASPQTAVEAAAGFSAVQDWAMGAFWADSGLGTNHTGIIAFSNTVYPDVALQFKGDAGLLAGARISNSLWSASAPTSLRLPGSEGSVYSAYTFTIDFGKWNKTGFDETVNPVGSAAFTLSASTSHWQNVSTLRAVFFDGIGNALSTQEITGNAWLLLRNAGPASAAYFGYVSPHTNISSIQIEVVSKNGAVLGFDDFGFTPVQPVQAESFAGQVERLRGAEGDRAGTLNELLADADVLATEPVWARAYSIGQMATTAQVNGVSVKYADTRSKYRSMTNELGTVLAEMYALASYDIGLSTIVFSELPYMAAAYRLKPTDALRDRLTNQLREISTWNPFQRSGWMLPGTSNPQTNQVDGVFLATGTTIQSLCVALNMLPADFFLNQESLRQSLRAAIQREVELTYSDWVNKIPWYVQYNQYQSNQWAVPASGMVIGAAYLGRELQQTIYDYGVAQLEKTLAMIGSDGSMSEGYGYGLSYMTTTLLLNKRVMESSGDPQWSTYGCFTNMPKWAAMCFQPNSNVVNSFDWYESQRSYGVDNLQDVISQLAAISDDNLSNWLIDNIYKVPAPTVFGMLCLGADRSAQTAPPLYSSFERSPMFIWRSSWSNQLSSGVWLRGGDSKDFHDHWDRGHLNFIFDGQPILIEAGTPGYADDLKSTNFDSVAGHNVLQVGDTIFPAKGFAALSEGPDISSTGGTVTFSAGETAGSAYYPTKWNRQAGWECNSSGNISVTDTVRCASASALTFRWHLASEQLPVIEEDPLTHDVTVTVPGGQMTLGSEILRTPAVTLIISASADISVVSSMQYDHTLKRNLSRHQHTTIEVKTTGAVTDFSMKTFIRADKLP